MNLNTLAMRAPQLLRSPTSRILISPPVWANRSSSKA
jgi:hypothetical protein